MLMLAKMMPGVSAQVGAGGAGYAELYAAIPNKVIVYRADQSTAANGDTLTASPWDNEVSATNSGGNTSKVWQTGSLNGYRGLTSTETTGFSSGIADTSLWTSAARSYTVFAVEKRSGTNGGIIISDGSQGTKIEVAAGACNFRFSYTDGENRFLKDSLISFSDGVPYVMAARVDGSGNTRFNVNGAVATPAGTLISPVRSGNIFFASDGNSNIVSYEYIASSDEIADVDMDAFVAALMVKWGIS